MQVLFDGDVTTLHIATVLLDSYTWNNRAISPRDYLKMVVVCLITAIKMTNREIDQEELIEGVHYFCKDLFDLEDVSCLAYSYFRILFLFNA